MEENIEGELDKLLTQGGDWISKWFKEVRAWEPSDIKCAREVRISIYGVPCFVSNKNFIEALLSNIGVCLNLNFLNNKPARLDVMSLMIFIDKLETIRNKIFVCLDGKWINILVVEEATILLEDHGDDSEDEGPSSDMGAFSVLDMENLEDEGS